MIRRTSSPGVDDVPYTDPKAPADIRLWIGHIVRVFAFVLFATWCAPASAQTAPSPSEIAAYQGLQRAAQTGNAAEIAKLATSGVDLERRDGNARTAVHIAAFAGKGEALAALAKAGADMNALEGGRYDAVTIAAVANDTATLEAALAAGNKPDNITSIWDGNALIAAAHEGNHESIALLIKAKSKLDHVNSLGWTAIIESIVLGDGGPRHQASLKLLLEAGADKTIRDPNGSLPVDLARQRGYDAMVALLKG
jgi:ankyrin repeat protein